MDQSSESDMSGTMAQSLTPAVEVPAPCADHDQPVSAPTAPVNQHSLAQYYQTGEYSDLEVVSHGFSRRVHKIIVCSESPVIKHQCSRLRPGQRLDLYLYDSDTLDRVLDFCYRRTYSDGENPETVAAFLLSMDADDVRDALEAPLAGAGDAEGSGWNGFWTQHEHSCDGEDEGEDEVEGTQEETMDEDLPDQFEIHYSTDDNSESSDDDNSEVNKHFEPQGMAETPYPPYEVSLCANLDVYIAAKQLQISALQLLARERFANTFRSHWNRLANLPALIDDVYLQTDKRDTLRPFICQIVAPTWDCENGKDFKADIRELMRRNGEFATDVLDTVLRLRSEGADME